MMVALRSLVRGLRWLVRLEVGIWRSLALWVLRRVPGRRPGVQELGYAKEVTPLLLAFTFVSLLELPVVHLLVPWEPARLALLVVGVWGVVWMLGFVASIRVFPHLLDEHGLRIRNGTTVDLWIPWNAVSRVMAQRRSVPTNRRLLVESGDDGAVISVVILRATRVDVELRGPTPIRLPGGEASVVRVSLAADDPRAFVAAARERLATARGSA